MKLTDKFESLPGIYVIRNLINGKLYVGETNNVKRRIKEHRLKYNDQIISRSIKKYGAENFEIEIRYFPDFSKDDLLAIEEILIKKFDCLTPRGYNVCPRGADSMGYKHTDESRRKMSLAKKGKPGRTGKISPEHRAERLGRKHSEEAKRKMSESQTGTKQSPETILKRNNSLRIAREKKKANQIPTDPIG